MPHAKVLLLFGVPPGVPSLLSSLADPPLAVFPSVSPPLLFPPVPFLEMIAAIFPFQHLFAASWTGLVLGHLRMDGHMDVLIPTTCSKHSGIVCAAGQQELLS